ncbi:MAG: DNA polymerase III subunit gamma/tau, partial [Verrucomicrobia bacterium]
LRQLNDLATHGKDLGRLLADLLGHFRNLLIFQVSRGDLQMLEVSEGEAGALAEQAKLAKPEGLTRILEVLAEAEMRLRDAASKKILIEVALLKAIEARHAVSLDSVLKQLQTLREGKTPDVASVPLPASAPVPSPKPSRAATSTTSPAPVPRHSALDTRHSTPGSEEVSGVQAADQPARQTSPSDSNLESLWAGLLEAVGRASPFTRTYLLEAHPVSFTSNVFTIGLDPEFQDHLGLLDNPRNHTLLQTKLLELGHPNAQIKFIKAEAPAARAATLPETPPPAPLAEPKAPAPKAGGARSLTPPAPAAKEKLSSVPFNKDQFKNDPLIQKALEIFKGQIVEVRA